MDIVKENRMGRERTDEMNNEAEKGNGRSTEEKEKPKKKVESPYSVSSYFSGKKFDVATEEALKRAEGR